MAATVLRSIQTCDTPVVENRDDGGWRVVTHACGCSRTYGAYHGFGCRNLLSTTVCDTRVSVCRGCGMQDYPHNDCVCHLVEDTNE